MEGLVMERIKNLREEHQLKQDDIAHMLGIKRSTYTSYEIGRDTIPIKHLNELCNYFNISIDYALGLSDIKRYPNYRLEIDKELLQKRLKLLRREQKLTQEEIAKVLNTSRSTWTGYEAGKYLISTLSLYELAKRYHYSMDFLLGKIDR